MGYLSVMSFFVPPSRLLLNLLHAATTSKLLKPAIPVIFLGQPARLSESIPVNSEDPDAWAETFWTARMKEAKIMVQVIGILLTLGDFLTCLYLFLISNML